MSSVIERVVVIGDGIKNELLSYFPDSEIWVDSHSYMWMGSRCYHYVFNGDSIFNKAITKTDLGVILLMEDSSGWTLKFGKGFKKSVFIKDLEKTHLKYGTLYGIIIKNWFKNL